MTLKRRWVKVEGSDVRLVYPDKRVDSPEGCTCDHFTHADGDRSAGVHFSFESDLSATPRRQRLAPTLLEDCGGGEYASWSPGVFGCIGSVGKLRDGVKVVALKTKADFAEAACLEAAMARSMPRMTHVVYRLQSGDVHVQNYLLGQRGQHHVHTDADFAAWVVGINPDNLEEGGSLCPCASSIEIGR